jgi:hypothetical protein
MHSYTSSRQSLGARQEGVALIVTLLVLMLVSALMVGFVAAVVADQRASGLDRDQTQAYAASHAGMEQLTSDLSALFQKDFSPSGAQIAALRNTPPVLPGFSFIAPGGGSNSGYMVEPRYKDGSGNPLPEPAPEGSPITVGPYEGFKGIITPYDITVTARSTGLGGAEVRMRRSLQTVAIPVFQFGMFSETDLAFHAGAEAFYFGGRVHTNGNLFLAAADGGTLTISDRITAVGDVIRQKLPNGLATSSGYTGAVKIPTTIKTDQSQNVYRNLGLNEGSLTGTIPRLDPPTNENGNWFTLSTGTYKNNIRNGITGAKRLDLPLVADLNSDGLPDAQPIELIRRPITGPPYENITTPIIYSQRYYAQASLRILLSDADPDLLGLPTICPAATCPNGANPVSLTAASFYGPAAPANMKAPLARSSATPGSVDGALPAGIYKSTNESLPGGVLKIEAQKTDGTWIDVTDDILSLGIAGRNPADANVDYPYMYPTTSTRGAWNRLPDSTSDVCPEPHPNAVLRFQRIRDVPKAVPTNPPNNATSQNPSLGVRCGVTLDASNNVIAVSQNPTDYWPLALYDAREGEFREVDPGTMMLGGLMHYVELDVANLKKWLAGTIGTKGTQAKNDNGYIVYFSDRRNNGRVGGKETGEYGFEDTVNLTKTNGIPSDTAVNDAGEDVNGNGSTDNYGRLPLNVGTSTGPFDGNARPWTVVPGGTADAALIARANRPVLFRRALKIVDGDLGNLPQGLTIVAENPVYVEGDYNATSSSVLATTNVPAAIIADAVTLLSNAWQDVRSFTSPTRASARPASTTGYRMAVVTGKGMAFPKPASEDASFGSDGGAHNFVRLLEDWNTPNAINRYRGSMVSFFLNRQATGTFKCCNSDAYTRGDRDWSFDTDFRLPSKLPPGTPMFRDVNTLTFRQLLRPTQ